MAPLRQCFRGQSPLAPPIAAAAAAILLLLLSCGVRVEAAFEIQAPRRSSPLRAPPLAALATAAAASTQRIANCDTDGAGRRNALRATPTRDDACGGDDFGPPEGAVKELTEAVVRRRAFLRFAAATTAVSATTFGVGRPPPSSVAASPETASDFRSGAYGREEYTNSIVASRDTNISPREAYDTIENQYVRYPLSEMQKNCGDGSAAGGGRSPRALDVGAGAGVSTQVLWDMGYRSIDAVDWSSSAWERFVVDDPAGSCPGTVRFFELDDERYLDIWRSEGRERFDVIVFNFAVNESKARQFARELLNPDFGRLLAPVNAQSDYWLKQTYRAYDAGGNVLWSAGDVGAWSVQFQPDVTQDTCQGIWCSPFNGFQKKQ